MKKLILAVLALSAFAFGQKTVNATDAVVDSVRVWVPKHANLPSDRWVSGDLSKNDSLVVVVRDKSGTQLYKAKYIVSSNPLDTANVRRMVLRWDIVDVSK